MAESDTREHDERIAAMFDRVAPRYDLLNRVLSLRHDAGWRRRAVDAARLGPNEHALDVGTGTGDLAFDLLKASHPSARVTGVDLSEAMLALARKRAARFGFGTRYETSRADGQHLPQADASLDRVVASFAVRNFGDLATGLREMRRVLRPGGRAVILELSTPPNPFVRLIYGVYFSALVPRIARLFGGDRDAYRYLPLSVAAFPAPERLAALLREAGFARVRFERLTLGAATLHVADT
jgi:demethylmenaquinone methyltransferase / 2-methoxy-6-polyprenyl-1,4-benzoquinol methylase